tara:strand:- start:3126 stop:4274 length:1149 start_codon:yes stop_codon:yes gene_type:complete
MKSQKICIIGGGLTGLVTAISLSRLNCHIDLIVNNLRKKDKSNRTIAITENNLDFLNGLNIAKNLKEKMWPSSIMELYGEVKNEKCSKIFEINNHGERKKILYMIENSKIVKMMMDKIKKIKNISIKNNKRRIEIDNFGLLRNLKFDNYQSKYNLIILCTGGNSNLVKDFFKDRLIKNSYKELSISTILSHASIKNNIARQFFLNNEILAMLPISRTKTAIVWSIKKKLLNKKNFSIKKKIQLYTKNFLKRIKFFGKVEYKDLTFLIRNTYFQDRILLFGDALHTIHPFVGQGFNMTLRDLTSLENILNKKINLGLDIGSSDILSEFANEAKPRNLFFSLGVNFLKKSFSYKKPRNDILKLVNKNNFAKQFFFNIADKGLKF